MCSTPYWPQQQGTRTMTADKPKPLTIGDVVPTPTDAGLDKWANFHYAKLPHTDAGAIDASDD